MSEKAHNRRRRYFLGFKFWCGLFLALGVIALVTVVVVVSAQNALSKTEHEEHGVPIIEINLKDTTFEEIDSESKDIKYDGNVIKIYDGDVKEYSGVEIKGRGNGTWAKEKKPYQIKFDNKEDLFGLGKAKKWYLLANALDGTNLRTMAAFYLEGMLGMKYVYDGQFVELYADGEYRGLYYLTHAIEIGKDIVDLRDPMGVIMEIDNIYGDSEEYYLTDNEDMVVIKDLVDENNRDVVATDFIENYNKLEKAIHNDDYAAVEELVDTKSLAQYYLISEFSVNPDAYWTSFYFYKDGDGDKIHAGPMWDFDLAFSNRRWGNWLGERLYSSTEKMARKNEILPKEVYEIEGLNVDDYVSSLKIATLVYDLMGMSEFQDEVKKIFNERMSGRKDEFVNALKMKRDEIYDAAVANEERWSEDSEIMKNTIRRVFGNKIKEGYEFEMEFDAMLDWIMQRYDYFEREYGDGLQKSNLYI